MFIYSGRYKDEGDFDKALKFFAETIYNKHIKIIKEKKRELIEKIKQNPKSFGIDIIVKKKAENKEIEKKDIQVVGKPSLRAEYRKRTNRRNRNVPK